MNTYGLPYLILYTYTERFVICLFTYIFKDYSSAMVSVLPIKSCPRTLLAVSGYVGRVCKLQKPKRTSKKGLEPSTSSEF